MSDTQWLLVKRLGEGGALHWLTEPEMRALLADPSRWGVEEFKHIEQCFHRNPAYWPDPWGVLLRVEVVVPVTAGYRLPGDGTRPEPFEPTAEQVRFLNEGAYDPSGGGPMAWPELVDPDKPLGKPCLPVPSPDDIAAAPESDTPREGESK